MSETRVSRGAIPAADVARILDAAGVPSLLFGWWADIDFVIPDSHFARALDALHAQGFEKCTNPTCNEFTPDRFTLRPGAHEQLPPSVWGPMMALNRTHAVADAHIHLDTRYTYFTVLSLYKKSRLLWSLPDITLDPIPKNDPRFMFTNEADRLPSWTGTADASTGAWSDLYPVKTLTHTALVEALMRLLCRDYGDREFISTTWKFMVLNAIGMVARDKDNNVLERLVQLRDNVQREFQPLVACYIGMTEEYQGKLIRALRDYLIAHNELPDIPSEVNI
ncbi:hypothetical protein BJX61DRAFT_541787 [Aspergillus egyptiacus]|nr:hypothetical protein BJX61DRAFT_541787 [Aspergillus egyptiacus]